MAELYRQNGVQVHYIERMQEHEPNGMFVRDLVAMTPEGAIVARRGRWCGGGRRAMRQKRWRGWACRSYTRVRERDVRGGRPDVGEPRPGVCGDQPAHNAEGNRQVQAELERIGVGEIVTIQVPWSEAHFDGLMTILDRKLAAVYSSQASYTAVEALRRHGFKILEVTSEREVRYGMALNVVALEPGR